MKVQGYYLVGISGHRDLLPSQMDENFDILKGHLLKLKREHKEKKLRILSPLAEGADRLIVQVAISLGIEYDVILPMSKELYIQDFSKKSQKEFNHFLIKSHSVQVINLYAANTYSLISKPSIYRDFQYRQVGREIVEMVDELIIMGDGIQNDKMGGTSDITNYAKAYGTMIYTIWCDRLCA